MAIDMSAQELGTALALFVILYFLFRIGYRLANNDFIDTTFAWIVLTISFLLGWLIMVDGKNYIGLLGFIPAVTLIVTKIFNGIDFDYQTAKKLKGWVFSSVASVVTYIITHTVFGFGIPEATASAFVAAIILGILGYTA